MEAIVVGAGSFGASLAWWLARAGHDVTIVDQFAPGDPRATSGGESRLIRCGHGDDADYTASARRAWSLWGELEAESGVELVVRCGLVWFAHREDGWESAAHRTLSGLGIPVEWLSTPETARLYPSFAGDDLTGALLEPEAGVVRAALAVQTLAERAAAYGARLERAVARPDGRAAVLDDGRRLEADVVVWACGAWLGALFPGLMRLATTRQDLYFFDGGPSWATGRVPAWVDYDHAMYGTGDLDGLGAKAATDAEGPPLAPEAELPAADPANERRTRDYLARRFPNLAAAPLAGSKTCRYELSADSHFIAAEHPEHPGVWLLGGGSGHGFKHGPALAEQVAGALEGAALPARFALRERVPGRSLRTAGSNPGRAI
jgi:glycine/D-amino acid oxidase-like deaminating enzyme